MVECITDEFCSMVKTGDAFDKMNATVQHGIEDDSYHYNDEDVNRNAKADAVTANVAGTAAINVLPKKGQPTSKASASKRKKVKK